MTIIVPVKLSSFGIAEMCFGGLSADDIRAYRDDVIHSIKEVRTRGQQKANKAVYTPQNKPIECYIEHGECWNFGLLVDVFACTDELIEQNADRIIERLCRDAIKSRGVACERGFV